MTHQVTAAALVMRYNPSEHPRESVCDQTRKCSPALRRQALRPPTFACAHFERWIAINLLLPRQPTRMP